MAYRGGIGGHQQTGPRGSRRRTLRVNAVYVALLVSVAHVLWEVV